MWRPMRLAKIPVAAKATISHTPELNPPAITMPVYKRAYLKLSSAPVPQCCIFCHIPWPSYAKDVSGCGLAGRRDHRRSIPRPHIRPANNRRCT
jgi:hypothetical protein